MKVEIPKEISPELAEETGWHIGDGSMNFYNNKGATRGIYQLRGHIEDDKQHYIDRIKPIFKMLYNVDINLREMPSTRVFGFQIWSDNLVKFKQSLGLKLGPKVNITIPEVFLKDKELKIAIMKGIFDTDGCIYLQRKNNKLYPRLEIKTISLRLAEQLKNLCFELGLRATMYKNSYKNIGNRKQDYAVVIRGDEMFHRFMEVIKPANHKHNAKYSLYRKSFK